MKKEKKEKYLFALDLDGTVLSSSTENTIHPDTEKAIRRAIDEGHIVSIVTGRPWVSTKKIYEQLGLDTIVGNFNGAHVHNPKDEFFIDYIQYLDMNEILYLLGDKNIKSKIKNIAIEGPGWVQLEKRDETLEKIFSFYLAPKFIIGIDLNKLPLKPTGIVLDLKENIDARELKNYLKIKYGDLATFSFWSKGEGETLAFDITSIGVEKSSVISLLIRYYDIEIENTVAIGDSFNDESMFKVVNYSVCLANGNEDTKKKAKYITKKTNKEGGVGEFINNFLDNLKK
ncbi:MAG: Cof-type HAD-IIB family hydrolase [Metamycoplasmataceae bacterium]